MVPDKVSLKTETKDLEQYILDEDNLEDLNDIVKLFNISLKKRDLIRSSKLSEAQDKVVEQIMSRVSDRPDNFSNDDLLKYFKTIQDTISKTDVSMDNVKAPTIQVNQQINVANDEFNRESRMRIIDTVNKILQAAQNDSQIIEDVIDIEEENITTIDG